MNFFGKKKYKILILGSDGMLGHDVKKYFFKKMQCKSTNIYSVVCLDKESLLQHHITNDPNGIMNYFETHIHFDYCINCVAMTNTRGAESDIDCKKLSYTLNALFPLWLSKACTKHKTRLIHISTDYVFSEYSINLPFYEFKKSRFFNAGFDVNVEPFPIGVYGTHKMIGEQNIIHNMDDNKYVILRTSWLYGSHDQKSFLHRFFRNCLNNKMEIRENEYSVPTSTRIVIEYINYVIDNSVSGILHAVCHSIDGPVSRKEFALQFLRYYNDLIMFGDGTKSMLFDLSNLNGIYVKQTVNPQYSYMKNTLRYVFRDGWRDELLRFMVSNKNQFIE